MTEIQLEYVPLDRQDTWENLPPQDQLIQRSINIYLLDYIRWNFLFTLISTL